MNSSSGFSGTARRARRAKARTCAGRDGFSQYRRVSPIGSSAGMGVPALERPSHGLGQGGTIELEAAREMMEIEEILMRLFRSPSITTASSFSATTASRG